MPLGENQPKDCSPVAPRVAPRVAPGLTTGLTTTPPGEPRDLRGSGGGLHSPPGSPLPSLVSRAHLGAEKKRGKSRG